MLLPDRCAACGTVGPSPCPRCVLGLRLAPRLEPLPPLVSLGALLAYEGAGRSLVTALKYRGARTSLAWLADGLSRLVVAGGADLDAVAWAPTSGARRRARGFDQARLLAQAVGRRTGLPVHDVLRRLPGRPQTGRSRQERLAGPRFAAARPVPGRSYLIVDDVVTTGATLAAAARALEAAGARRVVALAAAATPTPVHDGFPCAAHSAGPWAERSSP
jgi:predicted amidophosphoribosyltransferase